MNMKKCLLLVGLPCSGKTTLITDLKKQYQINYVVSSDNYIEEYALKHNSTYSKVYAECIDDAINHLKNDVKRLILENKSFIWDQTNLSIKSRASKINELSRFGYELSAFVFNLTQEEHSKRLQQRNSLGDKYISRKLIENMRQSYQEPTYSEKIKFIYLIDNFGNISLKKYDSNESIKIK